MVSNGSATYTVATGDILRFEAEGTSLKLYRNRVGVDTLVASTTDGSIASGKTGLTNFVFTGGSTAAMQGDNFAMGDFGAGVATNTPVFDAVSSSALANTTNTISWTHTVGSGSNRLLAGCAYSRDTVAGDTVLSSVTVNGLAATIVRQDSDNAGSSSTFRSALWYLVNPGAGSNTIVLTWANPLASYGVGSAISFTGVDQASPLDAQAGATSVTVQSADPSNSVTTVANHALIMDCVLDSSSGAVVGAGQTERVNTTTTVGVDSTLISTTSDKTPAGAEAMNWTIGSGTWASSAASFKPATVTPVVEPNILTMTLTAGGATGITYNATTPTNIRVFVYTNSGSAQQSFVRPIADFSGGNFTYTWPNGYDGVCLFPINSTGVEINMQSSFYVCGSLAGIVAAADTTPIVMTQILPTGSININLGTTTYAISVDKPGVCYVSSTNYATYALMVAGTSTLMSPSSLTQSATVTAPANGTTGHFYTHCQFVNTVNTDVPTTTALDGTITVLSANVDTTPPSDPTNLAATPLSQSQVNLAWTASTGTPSSYQVYIDLTGLCATGTRSGLPVTTTTTVVNLPQSTPISFTVTSLDAAGNESGASNCVTVTTTPVTDVNPPSNMTDLAVVVAFKTSVVLGWTQCTDDRNSVTSTIEQCTGAACTDFAVKGSQISTTQLLVQLSPGTAYRFRGICSDGVNSSLGYSNIVDITTQTIGSVGLDRPRAVIPFGVQRLPRE